MVPPFGVLSMYLFSSSMIFRCEAVEDFGLLNVVWLFGV